MKTSELPSDVKKYFDDELKTKGLSRIKVKSWSGSYAALAVLQVYGFFLYQSYISLYSSLSGIRELLLALIFGGWLVFALIYVQTIVINQIKIFLSTIQVSQIKVFSKDVLKLGIGAIAIYFWVSFILGYYIFPFKNSNNHILVVLFQIISIFISWMLTRIERSKFLYQGGISTSRGKTRLFGLALSILLMIFLYVNNQSEVVGIFFLIPASTFVVLLISWLVEE